jgi:hypothetical protein
MVGVSLTARHFVVNVNILTIEKRLTTVRTLSPLQLDHSLCSFGMVAYLFRLFIPLFKIILKVRIIWAGIAPNQDMPLNAGVANAIEHHTCLLIHKTPLTAGISWVISPIAAVAPREGLVWMAFANPASELPEEVDPCPRYV